MSDWRSVRFRLVGLLPLLIFLYRLEQYIEVGTPDWIMYNCNITLVMLSLGMILLRELPIRVAAIWLAIGVPMWLIDAWVLREIWIASILSHIGGFLLALYAVRRVRLTGGDWMLAALWFYMLQLVTRFTTAPRYNVNIAHFPYEFTRDWFSSYLVFWPVCAVAVLLLTWLAELILVRHFPVEPGLVSESELTTIDDEGVAGDIV